MNENGHCRLCSQLNCQQANITASMAKKNRKVLFQDIDSKISSRCFNRGLLYPKIKKKEVQLHFYYTHVNITFKLVVKSHYELTGIPSDL